MKYPSRVPAALGIVCALACIGAFQSYRLTAEYHDSQKDLFMVERAQTRFAAAKAKLPPGAKVGYVSDLAAGTVAGETAFRAAQYALAPSLLVSAGAAVKTEWAVGNFSRPQDFALNGFEVAEDLGQGVILYRAKQEAAR